MKNNNLEQRYKEMIEDNVNVGKTNDGVEFLILIVGIVGILFITYLFVKMRYNSSAISSSAFRLSSSLKTHFSSILYVFPRASVYSVISSPPIYFMQCPLVLINLQPNLIFYHNERIFAYFGGLI